MEAMLGESCQGWTGFKLMLFCKVGYIVDAVGVAGCDRD